MTNYQVYQDIQTRTGGEIYIGVVGPVRTGKSTFIRRFMETLVLPALEEKEKKEIRDQLPLSGSGKIVTTVEPKFIPKKAVQIRLGEDVTVKIRLIDCVGFMIPEAVGNMEDGKERMVKTPWFDHEILFSQAAEIGTRKVIEDHSSIGIVVTGDGSFGEISEKQFRSGLDRTIAELKKQKKPFLILINSQKPYSEEASALAGKLEETYQVSTLCANCDQLKKEDILRILEKILYEFPVSQVQFYIPKWVEMLPPEHELKANLLEQIQRAMGGIRHIRDVVEQSFALEGPYVQESVLEQTDLATGTIRVRVHIRESYYYQMLSQMTGIEMDSEYSLIRVIKEFAQMKEEYVKVQGALESVRGCGYGVVTPELEEISMEEPQVIRQGNKFGVKIKSNSPSIHMIKANIETEIAPIVGTQEQAEDLIRYIKGSADRGESVWETNIFGKSIEQLVEEGIRNKIAQISEESQVKLQDTMKKIVNDSKGGMVCIII